MECLQPAAWCYLTLCRGLLYGEWNNEEWRTKHLEDYIVMCGEFAEEIGGASSAVQRSVDAPTEPEAF